MEVFPDNTLTKYVTKLPNPIKLSGRWEAGLVEIHFPHSWYNVRPEDTSVTILHVETATDGPQRPVYSHTFRIDAGFYNSPKQLVAAINEGIKKHTKDKRLQLEYNEITQKITSELTGNMDLILHLADGLREILGFTQPRLIQNTMAESVVDTERGFHSLYVYCDILETRIVGDTVAPLLRIINNRGKDGENVSKVFDSVYYIPVQKTCFDTIEIDIRDDSGRAVPFERGKVVLTLHFRESPSFS